MRPGQNKRMRGRNRRGPNPLTRSYESNGPDVKIRGSASHVAEKYVQLARDAHASGDPVAAESYLQHAEHYLRLIAAAQAQVSQQNGFGRDDDRDDGTDEDDFDSDVNDRFAFRPPQMQNPQSQPQPYMGGERDQDRGPQERHAQGRGDQPRLYERHGEPRQGDPRHGEGRTGEPRQPDQRGGERTPADRVPYERVNGERPQYGRGPGRPGGERPHPVPTRQSEPEVSEVGAALPAFITGGRVPGEPVPAPDAAEGSDDLIRSPYRNRRRRRGRPRDEGDESGASDSNPVEGISDDVPAPVTE